MGHVKGRGGRTARPVACHPRAASTLSPLGVPSTTPRRVMLQSLREGHLPSAARRSARRSGRWLGR